MKPAIVILVLMLAGGAHAAAIWEVDYFTRGDVSQLTHFYEPGSYEFLWMPDYVTVYRFDPGHTTFLGFYGSVELPDGFPVIAFPVGFDQAVAVAAPDVAVPEPATWLLLVAGVAGLIAARRHERRD